MTEPGYSNGEVIIVLRVLLGIYKCVSINYIKLNITKPIVACYNENVCQGIQISITKQFRINLYDSPEVVPGAFLVGSLVMELTIKIVQLQQGWLQDGEGRGCKWKLSFQDQCDCTCYFHFAEALSPYEHTFRQG